MSADIEVLLAIAQDRLQATSSAGQNLSGKTIHCYVHDVRVVFCLLNEQGIPVSEVQPADLQRCLDALAKRYRSTTVRRVVVSLRRVCQALVDAGILPHNPALHLRVPKCRQAARRTPPLSVATLKRLLEAPPNSIKGVRDRAMLAAMVCHGLSVSEICQLDVDDVDLEANTLRVTGRRGRVRTVMLIPQTAAILRCWVAARRLFKPATSALFISLHWTAGRAAPGQRISTRGVRQMVRRYLAQVDVEQPGVSCQALRRAYTALTRAAGADLRSVAASLGHAITATT